MRVNEAMDDLFRGLAGFVEGPDAVGIGGVLGSEFFANLLTFGWE
ncbi:MAG: hypothetical protein HW380_1210 [Magnetococcales bacterium]|nr:hypothetical protein [Magnetococcales bacterium]